MIPSPKRTPARQLPESRIIPSLMSGLMCYGWLATDVITSATINRHFYGIHFCTAASTHVVHLLRTAVATSVTSEFTVTAQLYADRCSNLPAR